jgi:hypothetical protein
MNASAIARAPRRSLLTIELCYGVIAITYRDIIVPSPPVREGSTTSRHRPNCVRGPFQRTQLPDMIRGVKPLITGFVRIARPARSASRSSTDRNCRRCSARDKIRDGRNSASRPYTSTSAYNPVRHGLDRTPGCEGSAADDSPAESRSHASDGGVASGWARRTQRQATATAERPATRMICATLLQARRSSAQMRFKSRLP